METKKIIYNGEEFDLITKLDDEDMEDEVLVEDKLDDTLDLTDELSNLNGVDNDSD